MKKTRNTTNVVFTLLLIVFAAIALVPFLWVVSSSFKGTLQIFSGKLIPDPWRWQNYPETWEHAHIGSAIINSVIIVVCSVTISLFIDVLAGYSFAKLRLRKHPAIFYLYLGALAIPLESNVFSMYIQIRNLGLDNTHMGVVLALVGTGTAFGTFMMRNFFRDISDSYAESARLDGASDFVIFSRIYLQMAAPGVMALAVYKILGAWNEYNLSLFILTKSELWTVSLTVATLKGFTHSNYGWIFAGSVMMMLPTIICYILFNKSFVSGITVGGEKG